MRERTKGFWFIFGGSFFLLFGLNLIIKIVLILLGLWMINRGMRLRGSSRLFERARFHFYTFMR